MNETMKEFLIPPSNPLDIPDFLRRKTKEAKVKEDHDDLRSKSPEPKLAHVLDDPEIKDLTSKINTVSEEIKELQAKKAYLNRKRRGVMGRLMTKMLEGK